MPTTDSPDTAVNASVLKQLEHLRPNDWTVAFGPDGKQFCGTPNGYHASYLPESILAEVSAGRVKKIVWASFGNTPDSWFFAYESKDGTPDYRLGQGTPLALRQYVQFLGADHHFANLRIQLGDSETFVVWTGTVWACSNVPQSLQAKLCQLSSAFREHRGVTMGSLKAGTLDNVQWHHDGTFYVKSGDRHMWYYHVSDVRATWDKLWQEKGENMRTKILNELAYVTIDPHEPTGKTFAFLKKQQPGKDTPFVLRFGQECMHTNLWPTNASLLPENRLQRAAADEPVYYLWATSRKSGRPHAKESWELELKKGEKVKVLQDMGRDWFVIEGRKNTKGWAHRSWLDFGHRKLHSDPRSAYAQFHKDLQKVKVPGQLCSFPSMTDYIDTCTKPGCQSLKDEVSSLGICVHDLLVLLEGSGCYSYEWLKEERNVWHPDRFAQFCRPEQVGCLKPKAEQMFVLYGILMDGCKV